jgi:hypothetical protein
LAGAPDTVGVAVDTTGTAGTVRGGAGKPIVD